MIRTLKLHEEFVIGFLAEGFSHRFKVERGLPADSKVVTVRHDSENHVIELGIESATWNPEDQWNYIDLVVHELPN
jgi:hypothetical protein